MGLTKTFPNLKWKHSYMCAFKIGVVWIAMIDWSNACKMFLRWFKHHIHHSQTFPKENQIKKNWNEGMVILTNLTLMPTLAIPSTQFLTETILDLCTPC